MEPAPREKTVIVYRCSTCSHTVRHEALWKQVTKRREGAPASLPCPMCGPGAHCDPLEAYIDNNGNLTTRAPIERVWFRGQRIDGTKPWWGQA